MWSESFVDYIETNAVYVDKSLLVRAFLDSREQVSLIAYPHGWGKSVNLKMIETFLQISVDKLTGKRQTIKSDTRSYKLFANGELRMKTLKQKLKISADKELIERHLAEYPVVFFSLEKLTGLNFDEVFAKFKRELSKLFKNFEFVNKELQLSNISAFDRFQLILNEAADFSTSIDALRFLSSILFNHFKKKVVVLLDDYDWPIQFSLSEPHSSVSDLTAIVNFVKKLTEKTFSENEFLEKGLVSGVFRLVMVNMFTDSVSFLVENTPLRNEFVQFYGFTDEEVDLVAKVECGEDLDQPRAIKRLLRAFQMSDFNQNMLSMFCPLSVIRHLHESSAQLKGNTNLISRLLKFFSIREVVLMLINADEITTSLGGLKFTLDELVLIKKFLNEDEAEISTNLLLSFLFAVGFLTLNRTGKDENLSSVRIANKEIRNYFEQSLLASFGNFIPADEGLYENLAGAICELFWKSEEASVEQLLAGFFTQCPNFMQRSEAEEGEGEMQIDAEFFHEIAQFLCLRVRKYMHGNFEVWYKKRDKVGIILVESEDFASGIAIVLRLDRAYDAIQAAEIEADAFFQQKNTTLLKSIFVDFFSDLSEREEYTE